MILTGVTHLTDFYCNSNPHKLGQIPGIVTSVVYIIEVKINTIIININNNLYCILQVHVIV